MYFNVDEIHTALRNYPGKFPGRAFAFDLPNPTAQQTTPVALLITTAPVSATGRIPVPSTGRDAVLVLGGVHGCEWGSSEIALNLASDLLESLTSPTDLLYGGSNGKTFAKEQIAQLLSQRDVIIFPLVNPDGRRHSQTQDETWRKNRNASQATADPASIGVDLNRNFDFVFELDHFARGAALSASALPVSSKYQGFKAGSEAETVNVVQLLDDFPVRWMVDLHSAGPALYYPWNHDEAQIQTSGMNFRVTGRAQRMGAKGDAYREFIAPADLVALKALANRFALDLAAVRGKQYPINPAFAAGAFPGTSHDYAYARHLMDEPPGGKVLSLCCEWGDYLARPDWLEMENIIEDVTAGLIGFCLETL